MKCHYEILSLERDAEDAQIKTAYRKAALKYHPDKNLDDPEGAKVLFQLVQQAYEVLSDPQERAWYDKHREQILRGGDSNYEDNSLDVYQYFTATCYKGFDDDATGFYAVYGQVFHQLATEELEYLETEAEFEAIPKFGNSTSDYEDVVHRFYSYWQSFCTKKSYSWLSTYNINEIRDRRILKVYEKENKKVAQKARKERNEEIRSLVAFVRKRDKRVQVHRKLMEEKAAENRKKQAQLALDQMMRRKQEIEEQKRDNCGDIFNRQYEEQLRQLEKSLKMSDDERDAEDHLMGSGDDIHIDADQLDDDMINCSEFYCVACNKTFRTSSSFRNHESSKKHKENVQRIKSEMLEEEDAMNEDESDSINEDEDAVENESDHLIDEKDNGIVDDVKSESVAKLNEEIQCDEVQAQEEDINTPATKTKKKKQKKRNTTNNIGKESNAASDKSDSEPNLLLNVRDSESDDDWDAAPSKGKKSRVKASKSGTKSKVATAKPAAAAAATTQMEPALIKSAKAEVKPQLNDDNDSSNEAEASVHKCVTCNEQFSSKNKLFAHLKKTNHGVYIPKGAKTAASAADGKEKRAKGKKK